jgi:hypothetical protein
MRIIFQRTGGFAGARVGLSIDSKSLSPEEAVLLERMARAALRSEPASAGPRAGADDFQFRIEIQEADGSQVLSFTHSQMTPELSELVDRLTRLARQ